MLLLGPAMGLLVNVLIYVPFVVWLMIVPYTGHTREASGATKAKGLGIKEAIEILREVSGNRPIITMVALGGLSSLLVGNAFQAQMPEFAHDLGTEKVDFAYSALLAANAAGAVVGGMLLEGRGWLQPKVKTAIVCAILWCVVIAAFAAATVYPVALTLLFFAGLLNLAFYSMAQTIVQLLAPVNLRGRLVGLFAMSSLGLRAFSGVTVGFVGGLIGIHWSLGLSAMALLAITTALFAFTMSGREAKGEFS